MKTLCFIFLLFAAGLPLFGGDVQTNDHEKPFLETKAKANQGDATSQYDLGLMYAVGRGVPKDESEAVKWYRKAADQGFATAQSNLGFMYAMGRGVPKDETEAVNWYRKAADQGHANAQNNLGLMYAKGFGVPEDESEAYKWYLLSGAQGNDDARKHYAILERTLTPAQRAEGQRLAREFKAKPE